MRRWERWVLLLALVATPWIARGGVKGDLNDDGVVDVADALLLVRIVEGSLDPGTLDPDDVADVAPIVGGVGGNGTIDTADALLMLRCLQQDVDTDGLATPGENTLGTSPFLADTDDDGHIDPIDPDPLITSPPFVPPNLRVFDGTGNVTLTWTMPSGEISHYLIHRYGSDGKYDFFTADASAQQFVDTTAAVGVVHFYWIQAVSPRGQQAAFVQCGIGPGTPNQWLTGGLGPLPNPWFTVNVTGNTATFNWEQSPVGSVTGYKIYGATTAVPLGTQAGLNEAANVSGLTTTTHQLGGLSAGTHYFRIIAYSGTAQGNLASARQVAVVVN